MRAFCLVLGLSLLRTASLHAVGENNSGGGSNQGNGSGQHQNGGRDHRGGGYHSPAWHHAQQGHEYIRQGNYPAAYQYLTQAVQMGQNDPQTLAALSLAAYQTGDKSGAVSAAQQALAQDPSNKTALSVAKLAEAHAPSEVRLPQVSRPDAGSDERVSAAGPKTYPALDMMALAAPGPGASGGFSTMKLSPAQAKALEITAAIKRKDYAGAVKLADEALREDPKSASALNLRALAQGKLGNYDAALRDVGKALEAAPDSVGALLNKAWILNRMRRHAEALAAAEAALRRQPYNALAYWQKAVALAGLKNRKGMLDALAEAARLDPNMAGLYKRALELPEDADALLLLDADLLSGPGGPAAPAPFPWLPWTVCAGLIFAWLAAQLARRLTRNT